MPTIIELREKRAQAWEAAKSFLDTKKNADGLLSAEDAATYDRMEGEIAALKQQIDREERARDIELEMRTATSAPLTAAPGASLPKTGVASDAYRQAFWNAMRGRKFSNSLNEGSDPEGGYLVPDEFERTLVESLDEQNVMRQISNIIQTSSGERKIPVVATKGTASWVDEEGTITESDDTFAQVSLSAYKLGTLMKVSDELLNDSAFNLEAYIAREFARRIGAKEEDAFCTGNGSGKPTGVFHAPGGGQIGVTAASATDITLDEIIDLYYSLKSPYRARAVFLANDSTVKILRKLKDENGQYLWQPSVQAGAPDTLLSRPVYTSPYAPAIAAGANTVAFGDFSYYWIADRQGRIFKRLNELYATTGQVGFIATQRVDGKLVLPEAIQLLQQAGTTP